MRVFCFSPQPRCKLLRFFLGLFSSGLKAATLGCQSILLGHNDMVVAGGMESMSNAPFMLERSASGGAGLGDLRLIDAMQRDGLRDAITPVGASAATTSYFISVLVFNDAVLRSAGS